VGIKATQSLYSSFYSFKFLGHYLYKTYFFFYLFPFTLGCIATIAFIVLFYLLYLRKRKTRSDNYSKQEIDGLRQSLSSLENFKELDTRINDIVSGLTLEIQELRQNFEGAIFLSQKENKTTELTDIALQVSHDIRSPLAALEVILEESSQLQEDTKTYLRSAVNRIKKISDDLLIRYKSLGPEYLRDTEGVYLVATLLESLIVEKRTEYRHHKINIDCRITERAFHMFSLLNEVGFKRMLSNLINNAIEASTDNGVITVTFTAEEYETSIIKIKDTGKGIPKDLLTKIYDEGFSFNKEEGYGIGLTQAKQFSNEINGELKIDSVEHVGTTVTLMLPKISPPSWFVPTIKLRPMIDVVILDNDEHMHRIWETRLLSYNNDINIISLYSLQEFFSWEKEKKLGNNTLYLCEYELIIQGQDQIGLIEKLKNGEQSILLSSHADDLQVIKKCKEFDFKLLSKLMIEHSRITLLTPFDQLKSAVLIDDDQMVHNLWALSAKRYDINLETFFNYEDFKTTLSFTSKDMVIFIDSNLSDDIKGEIIAEELYYLGFTQLYLITGEQADDFTLNPYLIDVFDKTPPWMVRKNNAQI